MPDPPDPTDETPRAIADPLVAVLQETATVIERFSGRLEANEKADDELRKIVTAALTMTGERNATLDSVKELMARQAIYAEKQVTAAEALLTLEQSAATARAATAEARWQALTETAGNYGRAVFRHPVTVALGGALLLGASQWFALSFGVDLTEYMPTAPQPDAVTAPLPQPALVAPTQEEPAIQPE
jgi:hypothetical protein